MLRCDVPGCLDDHVRVTRCCGVVIDLCLWHRRNAARTGEHVHSLADALRRLQALPALRQALPAGADGQRLHVVRAPLLPLGDGTLALALDADAVLTA